MKKQIKITEDGSTSLYVEELKEIYHSIHGAIQESNHVFINPGLREISKKSVFILEIGMGTGLNVLLSYIFGLKHEINIEYFTLEKFPVEKDLIQQLNYINILGEEYKSVFETIHNSSWNKKMNLSSSFIFCKFKEDLLLFTPDFNYDLIFFDAFAPDIQPQLWEKEVFEKLYKNLNMGGILTTYSAKGIVKRRLREVGFKVELIPGPPGKREMIRARK